MESPPCRSARATQIAIVADGATPLLTRVIGQIKRAVLQGELCPNDELPSARQLANDLGIAEHVVATAYRLLACDDVLRIGAWGGVRVHRDARANAVRVGWSYCASSE